MKREELKDLFSFSKRERKGVVLFLIVIMLVGIVHWTLPVLLFKPKVEIKIEIIQQLFDSLQSLSEEEEKWAENQPNRKEYSRENTWEPQWESEPTFTSKYSSSTFEKSIFEKSFSEKRIVDFNLADSLELRTIKGIGPYLSRKIIQQRERLGGFTNFDQLKEIYRFPPTLADSLKQVALINQGSIRKIAINYCNDSILGSHFYLNRKNAKAVIAYREKHGHFRSCNDLEKCVVLEPKVIALLCPYLSFD
jgi:DNA uptake protein ComE-like DNA-binding protein